MAHSLIVGMSESGKTTLAKRKLVPAYKRNHFGIIVLDPLLSQDWQADFITADGAEFLRVFWQSRNCMAFIDESGEAVGRYNEEMQKTATRGRHHGHCCHYITQGATQLAPVVRDQCRHLFLFCASERNGKLLAEEWGKPELVNCAQLRQFEYIHAVKFGGVANGSFSHSRRAGSDGDGNSHRDGDGQRQAQGSSPQSLESSSGAAQQGSGETGSEQ